MWRKSGGSQTRGCRRSAPPRPSRAASARTSPTTTATAWCALYPHKNTSLYCALVTAVCTAYQLSITQHFRALNTVSGSKASGVCAGARALLDGGAVGDPGDRLGRQRGAHAALLLAAPGALHGRRPALAGGGALCGDSRKSSQWSANYGVSFWWAMSTAAVCHQLRCRDTVRASCRSTRLAVAVLFVRSCLLLRRRTSGRWRRTRTAPSGRSRRARRAACRRWWPRPRTARRRTRRAPRRRSGPSPRRPWPTATARATTGPAQRYSELFCDRDIDP